MSENNRVLVLMAGGYKSSEIQKHLLSVDGSYLFERTINAIPAKNVWIVHNQNTQPFWQSWLAFRKPQDFPDKDISFFIDKQNSKGEIKNPALWMSSSIPSYAISFGKDFTLEDIIYSAIDTYIEDYSFIDEFMSKENGVVVSKGLGKAYTDFDYHGKLERIVVEEPIPTNKWVFTDLLKVKAKQLLYSGQLPPGSMADVVGGLMRKGTIFNVVKAKGGFINCDTELALTQAQQLYSLQTKVLS